MSRKDLFHFAVRRAFEKDDRTITRDPLQLKVGTLKLEADLAEKPIAAQKDNRKIAVEVKSFIRTSKITEFYHAIHAIGQYFPYKVALQKLEPDRILYLAILESAYEALFGLEKS